MSNAEDQERKESEDKEIKVNRYILLSRVRSHCDSLCRVWNNGRVRCVLSWKV